VPPRAAIAAVGVGWLLTALAVVAILLSLESAAAPARAGGRDLAGARLVIAWAGDITPGSRYGLPPQEGRGLFGSVRRDLRRADLALGNLEGTLSTGGLSKCGADGGQCFSFQAPPSNAAALRWAGFDALNLANNHAFDYGAEGQRQTVDALAGERLAFTGRPGELTLVERRGVRIALAGFAPYPWASDLRDLAAVRALVARAARAADVVVVLMHAGAEGSDRMRVPLGREVAMGEDRGDTRAFARAAIDAGADLVLGSGPHVLRGMERRRGRLIAYSLGNFAGWHNFSTAGTLALSGLLTVEIDGMGRVRGGRLVPLRLSGPGVPVPDGSGAVLRLVDGAGAADFGRFALRLDGAGRFRAPRSLPR
jgi:hypothetical protein